MKMAASLTVVAKRQAWRFHCRAFPTVGRASAPPDWHHAWS